MKTFVALAAVVSLLGFAGFSHAGTIASAQLNTLHATDFEGGSLTGNAAACYVRNVGSSAISVTVTFYENFGLAMTPSFQNCNNAPLPAGRTCVVLINDLPDDVSFGCTAVAAGGTKNLRGTMEQRAPTTDGNFKTLIAEDLR